MWHIFWHSIWHSIWHIFWHIIWQIFWHSIWQTFWHFIWHIFWHSIWHFIWHTFWHSYGILSGISSGILSGISSGILSGRWGPAVRTELGRSQVEVQQCALSWEVGKGGGGCGRACALIQSNNPHLAGGEKMKILFLMKFNQFWFFCFFLNFIFCIFLNVYLKINKKYIYIFTKNENIFFKKMKNK